MRDIKYIIKRIIIGTGIALALMLIKGNFVLSVKAEELITRQPTVIGILADNSYNEYPIISNTGWDGHDVWSPGTQSNDWSGTARLNYNYAGGDYCTQTQNYGTLSGIFYNASTSLNSGTVVKFLYTTTSSEFTCSTNLSGNKGTFSCTGVDFTKNFTLLIYNASPGAYGVVKQLGYTCEASIGSQIENDNQNTQNIINNNNTNTQTIINNNNQNTQSIINNNNQNTQQQIESQKVCNSYHIDKTSIVETGRLSTSGTITNDSSDYGVSNYYSINSDSNIHVVVGPTTNQRRVCFYNKNRVFISCNNSISINTDISIPDNSSYVRFTINQLDNAPQYTLISCKNGNQAIADSQQQLNDTLNNDNVDGASDVAESFFDDFQSDSHGLSGIITAPLRLITSLSSSTCSPLSIPLPFVQTNATLPCMSTIYSTYFPSFLSLYQLITTGLIGYWVLIKIFGHVKGMQDPKDDRIEVLDL